MVALLPVTVQLTKEKEPLPTVMAPPEVAAELPCKVQFLNVRLMGEVLVLRIAPPLEAAAELPMKVVLVKLTVIGVTVALPLKMIAPPVLDDVLLEKRQSVTFMVTPGPPQ